MSRGQPWWAGVCLVQIDLILARRGVTLASGLEAACGETRDIVLVEMKSIQSPGQQRGDGLNLCPQTTRSTSTASAGVGCLEYSNR